MKNLKWLLIAVLMSNVTMAQTNTFPANGNVGIGLLDNDFKLTVDGKSKFTGNLYVPRSYIKDVAFSHPLSSYYVDFLLRALNPNTLELRAVVDENNFAFVFSIDKNSQVVNFYKPITSPEAVNDNELVNLGQLKAKVGNYVGISGNQEVLGKKYFMDNVGIGTTNPDAKLTVKGKIHAEEVKVDLSVPAPDYVFEDGYKVETLATLESYIKANKHLPEVPSAKTMEKEGINLSEMNMLLLKKVEELTLHLIEKDKELQAEKNKNVQRDQRMETIEKLLQIKR